MRNLCSMRCCIVIQHVMFDMHRLQLGFWTSSGHCFGLISMLVLLCLQLLRLKINLLLQSWPFLLAHLHLPLIDVFLLASFSLTYRVRGHRCGSTEPRHWLRVCLFSYHCGLGLDCESRPLRILFIKLNLPTISECTHGANLSTNQNHQIKRERTNHDLIKHLPTVRQKTKPGKSKN